MEKIYVLKLENDKYYIGKSKNLDTRIQQHKLGKGAEFTRHNKVIKVLEVRDSLTEHDESNLTKDYMKQYGIDNVRGGPYCQLILNDSVKSLLQREIYSTDDKCYKCGESGHFVRNCPEESEEESEEECYECSHCSKQFVAWYPALLHERRCEKQRSEIVKSMTNCYRCGRTGHYIADCYAITHIKGYELADD